MIFLSQPRFQCGFKIRLFFWWILVGCFPDIVTYTQWNSYFEAFGPGWIVIIQFADRIAKRQFFVEKLLTIIFQSASLQGQGVNTPNSSTVRPWKSDNWKTICTFLLRDSVFFQPRQTHLTLGFFVQGILPGEAMASYIPHGQMVGWRYPTWRGRRGQQGGVEEGCSLLVLMRQKIEHFFRLQNSTLKFDGGFPVDQVVLFQKRDVYIFRMFASSMYLYRSISNWKVLLMHDTSWTKRPGYLLG